MPRELHFDRNGYPLPPGAIARLGIPPALTGFAWSLAWTADGKQFVASDLNGITVFDAATGRWTETIPAEGQRTTSDLMFRHGPAVLKLQGSEGTLCDPLTGEQIVAFKLPSPLGDPGRKLYSLDLSANHRFLAGIASADSSPGVAWRFDLASKRYTRLINNRADLQSLRLSPDAKRVFATGGIAEPELTARDVVNGKELWTVPLKGVGKLRAVSADGRRVAVTDQAGLTVFDTVSGKVVLNTPIDSTTPAGMWGIDLSPDGSRLALSDDQVVLVWDTTTGKLQHRLAHKARLVAFSPDGMSLLTGSAWVQKWDLATGKEAYPSPLISKPVGASILHWSSKGHLLSVWPGEQPREDRPGHSSALAVWNVKNMDARWQQKSDLTVRAASIDPNGSVFRAATSKLHSWTISGLKVMESTSELESLPSDTVETIEQFLPDGSFVVQGLSKSGLLVDLYNTSGKHQSRRLLFDFRTGETVRDKTQIKLRSLPGTILYPTNRRVDVSTGRGLPPLAEHDGFSSVGPLCVGGSALIGSRVRSTKYAGGVDCEGKIWDSLTGGHVLSVITRYGEPSLSAISPNGRWLASTSDHMVEVRDLREMIDYFKPGVRQNYWRFPSEGTRSVAFSPDSRHLATGLSDGTVLVWNVPESVASDWVADNADSLWKNLGSDDPKLAWRALWHLQDHPTKATELLAMHLQPVPGSIDTAAWILKLDHARFNVREEAAKMLIGRGESIQGDLQAAIKAPRSEEQRVRLEQILLKLNPVFPPTGDALRGLRSIWLLERIGTREAMRLLEAMAGGASGSRVTMEAKLAMLRLNGTR